MPATNIHQFEAELDVFIEKDMVKELELIHRAAVLEVFRRLVLKSPVDKGRFRANWQIGDNVPIDAELFFDFGGDRESNRAAATREAVGREAGKVDGLTVPGRTWITNNVPYAQRLNQGWSDQAPAGFVELTLEEVARFLEGRV